MRYIKLFKVIAVAGLLCAGNHSAMAQHYVPTDQNSDITFKVGDDMIVHHTVTGHFSGLKGSITFDPNAPQKSSFEASVNTATIHTGIGKRDNDLRKDKYFNVDAFPTMTIKSTSVAKGTKANTYVMHANLTIKGISKPVTLPFTATPTNGGYIFKSNFTVNRTSYNVGESDKIDKNVSVSLTVFAKKQ